MKLLKLMFNNSGKMALSTLQAVGLAATVGLAGVGAWQMLSGGSDVNPDTAFSSYDDAEVVYVAGGADGEYNGANYGEGGEVRSGIRVKQSRSMQLMEQDAQRIPQVASDNLDRQEQDIQAFKMDGSTEGLGMGKNAAKDMGGMMGGDMSAFQQQLAQVQATAAAKQKEAEAAAQGSAAQAAANALGSGKFGPNSQMARAGGHNLNSTPLQAGGADSKRGGALGGSKVAGAGRVGDRLPPATREAKFEGGRESVIEAGRRYQYAGKDELDAWTKVMAGVTENAYRSDNAMVAAAMGAGQAHGIMRITGENVTTGGSSSSDFNESGDFTGLGNKLSALGKAANEQAQLVKEYSEAQEGLRADLDDFVGGLSKIAHANTITTVASTVGGGVLGGMGLGAKLGAAIGSIFPGLGTAIGAVIGTALGAVIGAAAGYFLSRSVAAKAVTDIFGQFNAMRSKIDAFEQSWGQMGDNAHTFADQARSIVDHFDNYKEVNASGVKWNDWNHVKNEYEKMRNEYWPDAAK